MFLKSIRLNNVKCFSDIFLSFENENGDIRKWTLLLAENGSGKSTLLKAIALVTSGSDAITDLLGNPSDWVRYKTQVCEISAVLVTTEGKEREIRLQIASEDTRPDVIKKTNRVSLGLMTRSKRKRDTTLYSVSVRPVISMQQTVEEQKHRNLQTKGHSGSLPSSTRMRPSNRSIPGQWTSTT